MLIAAVLLSVSISKALATCAYLNDEAIDVYQVLQNTSQYSIDTCGSFTSPFKEQIDKLMKLDLVNRWVYILTEGNINKILSGVGDDSKKESSILFLTVLDHWTPTHKMNSSKPHIQILEKLFLDILSALIVTPFDERRLSRRSLELVLKENVPCMIECELIFKIFRRYVLINEYLSMLSDDQANKQLIQSEALAAFDEDLMISPRLLLRLDEFWFKCIEADRLVRQYSCARRRNEDAEQRKQNAEQHLLWFDKNPITADMRVFQSFNVVSYVMNRIRNRFHIVSSIHDLNDIPLTECPKKGQGKLVRRKRALPLIFVIMAKHAYFLALRLTTRLFVAEVYKSVVRSTR